MEYLHFGVPLLSMWKQLFLPYVTVHEGTQLHEHIIHVQVDFTMCTCTST